MRNELLYARNYTSLTGIISHLTHDFPQFDMYCIVVHISHYFSSRHWCIFCLLAGFQFTIIFLKKFKILNMSLLKMFLHRYAELIDEQISFKKTLKMSFEIFQWPHISNNYWVFSKKIYFAWKLTCFLIYSVFWIFNTFGKNFNRILIIYLN